jgi:hypothetical protein
LKRSKTHCIFDYIRQVIIARVTAKSVHIHEDAFLGKIALSNMSVFTSRGFVVIICTLHNQKAF